ncbi:hypothetical protein [Methanoplanus limicola]|uniref:hypothetical protein n=1 Tax=Methanoplanus limicola TaxID=2315 RepID=UPI0012F6EE73|nr:hypothetical protein [Methanoplanus limicola]
MVYEGLYQVFHTEEIRQKARPAGVPLQFSPELWNIYPDRQFTNNVYVPDKSGEFLSDAHKEEIISHYSALGYAVDDLYPVRRCLWCDAPISGRNDKTFCSKKCAAAFRELCRTDEFRTYNDLIALGTSAEIEEACIHLDKLKDRIDNKTVLKYCLNCGNPVTRSNAKYCCDKCRNEYNNKKKNSGK